MTLNSILRGFVKILLFINLIFVILIILKLEISWIGNMVLYISPSQVFVNAYNNEIKPVSFKIETQSNYPCIVECKYDFVDASSNEIIENGTLALSKLKDSIKRFELKAPLLGTGQKVYTFSIECTNKRSVYCWFRNPKRKDSSIAFLTYRLREEEESVKNLLRNNLQEFLAKYSQADILNQEQEITISDSEDIVNYNEIISEIMRSKNEFAAIRNSASSFTGLWNDENYMALKDSLNSSAINGAINAIDFINSANNKISDLISQHNRTVKLIEAKKQDARTNLNIALLSPLPPAFINEADNLLGLLNDAGNSIKTGNFTNYSYIAEKIKSSDALNKRVKVFSDSNLADITGKGYALLNESYDSMCSIKGYCNDYGKKELSDNTTENLLQVEKICANLRNLDSQFKEADKKFILDYYKELHPGSSISDPQQAYAILSSELNLQSYFSNAEFTEAKDKKISDKIEDIKNYYISRQNEVSGNYNKNITELNLQLNSSSNRHANETLFDYCAYLIGIFNYEKYSLKNQFLFPVMKYACNDFLNSQGDTANASIRNISAIKKIYINSEIQHEELNISNQTISNLPDKYFILAWNMTPIDDSPAYINSYCNQANTSIEKKEMSSAVFTNADFFKTSFSYALLKKYNITSRVNTIVAEPLPTCCIFGECEKCCINESCRDEPSLFPVIMIHGHAFDKEQSPTFSFDIFDKIEMDLKNDGYVYSGVVTSNINYTGTGENELGTIRKPVSIKATYYIDFNDPSFSQSELNLGLENYSGRLNDIINFVRFKTGKSKVNIIAHSMGGLVARRYLQIYGENSVNKLILIASPNHGISENTRGVCLIAGRGKECYDMTSNSQFMKTINSIQLKNSTKIYNIYGIGCETDGSDGDKVVTEQSAILEGVKNYVIRGNCSTVLDVFHNQILDTGLHPETYNVIRSILKQK